MSLKLKLSQMRKISSDKTHTLMKTPEGHEIRIAHNALSKPHRKALESLSYAEGGQVSKPDSKDGDKKKSLNDIIGKPFKDGGQVPRPKPIQSASASGVRGRIMSDDEQYFAEGGSAGDDTPAEAAAKQHARQEVQEQVHQWEYPDEGKPKLQPERIPKKDTTGVPQIKPGYQKATYAEGGQVSDDEIIAKKKEIDDYNNTHEDEPKDYPYEVSKRLRQTDVTPPRKLAEGGDIDQSPIPIASSPDQAAQASASPEQVNAAAAQPLPPQSAPPVSVNPQGSAANPVQPQSTPQSLQKPQQSQDLASQIPSVEQGYQNQVQGAVAQANAEQQQVQAKTQALRSSIQAQNNIANSYQQAHDSTMSELNNIRDDINNYHIDPNHYLGSQDTMGKIGTAIGLVLGGIAGGGRGNQVLDFVNNQIDRDINSQKAELGKKESIYNGLLQQDQSHERATNMTRLLMNDLTLNKLQQAEMSTSSPIIKARAQQAIGQLQTQMAPMIRQENMYKMLQGGGQGLESMDPAQLVPYVVPADKQKDVFHEVAQAQNAARNKQAFMQAFDQASQENSVLGRASRLGFTPPSIKSMEMLSLPLIHDLEGRVNEYEQKTVQDNMPQPGDLPDTVARKRQSMENFFNQKSAAPTAKGFGIDLNKFKSTTTQGPQIKIVNGVKYMRGPNGEAIKVQ